MNQGYVDPRSTTRDKNRNKVAVLPDHGSNSRKPIPSSRGGDLADNSMVYEELKNKLLQRTELFEDQEFPAENSSLYYSQEPIRNIEWLRPHEICSNPQFITGGASRFDVKQGELGDCWLLAAIASLSLDEKLMRQVVVPDQDFGSDYRGIFRFNFWRFCQWHEIVIDDRLPTYGGRLLFMHSAEKNEFWSALFEKAYANPRSLINISIGSYNPFIEHARLFGSYEALKGGSTSEALEDFTGGICELFDLRDKTLPNLLNIMLKSQERRSLMGCSIDADPNSVEAKLPNGLIMGHAYSITAVKQVMRDHYDVAHLYRLIKTDEFVLAFKARDSWFDPRFTLPSGQPAKLVRVRNPWGNEAEWTGDWSDRSPKWDMLPGVNESKADGEFWMSYEDFTKEFQRLEICHLGPQSISGLGDQPGRKWELCVENGRWIKGVTAGGCLNNIETFSNNPQFKIKIVDPDEDDDENMGTVIVGLMQKNRRAKQKQGVDLLIIGYMIYKVSEGFSGVADKTFFKTHKPDAMSNSFINLREICGRHKLQPGEYIIVPSTFRPNEEGDFVLRIFTERPLEMNEANDAQGIDTDKDMTENLDQRENRKLEENFDKIKSDADQIDAEILRKHLNKTYAQTHNFSGFPLETCRSLVAMMDETFTKFDVDKSGTMNSMELRAALKAIGFSVNNRILETIGLRYAQADGTLSFNDFVACCVRLRTLVDIYKAAKKDQGANITMNEQHFFANLLYM